MLPKLNSSSQDVKSINDLEKEAAAVALSSGGRETKEQAFARMLELQPEIYAAYRARHNAQAILASLRQAGYSI